MNKNLVIYSSIFLLVIPFFGLNLILHLISNIFLLIFLVPILILLIALIGFNSLTSKVNICNQCGNVSVGIENTCLNCGSDLNDTSSNNFGNFKKPSETTIEVKAEEIK